MSTEHLRDIIFGGLLALLVVVIIVWWGKH